MQVHASSWNGQQTLRPLHLFTAVLCLCAAGLVHAATPTRLTDEALEARFWDCDARATVEVLSPGHGAQCVVWHDELKQRRFGGDFERMLAWWRDQKTEQHARRLGRGAASK